MPVSGLLHDLPNKRKPMVPNQYIKPNKGMNASSSLRQQRRNASTTDDSPGTYLPDSQAA